MSLATTQATVPGKTGSGGSETENFCYNEQNELVWASNATKPSPTSTETCGSQTPGNSLNGASYTTSYVYTNLGQLWQGPVAGGATTYQYLYCNTAPHQLSGLFASGSTCSNKSGSVYKDISYDAWGNVTSRTYNSATATLAYDELDQMVNWNVNANTNDDFAYDASGNRTVQRATNGGTTTLTVYAFGLEDFQYSGTGTLQSATSYYSLDGRLMGVITGLLSPVTVIFLSDALGNLMATFNNTQGGAAVQGNQVYGPYGNSLYSSGSMDTARGYTGQYADPLTGLDYYVSRYYDPVAGIFLSPDVKEGNAAGMNPYAYVAGNPETMTDPSGQMYGCPGCGNSGGGGSDNTQKQEQYAFHYVEQGGLGRSGLPVLLDMYLHNHMGWVLAESYDENVMHGSTEVLLAMEAYDLVHTKGMNWNASPALMQLFVQLNGMSLPMLSQMEALSEHDPEMATEAEEASITSVDDMMSGDTVDENGDVTTTQTDTTGDTGGPCSFTSATLVETNHGEQAIGTLKVGKQVLAYNPKTRNMEDEPILHVWIHTDNDLVDLTFKTKLHAPHSTVTTTASETIHTNKKHPFFTEEQGFVPVGQLKLGMHVLRADGRYGVVTDYKVVPGAKTMYNLEVAQDHTFTVGVGQWVVHNSDTCGGSQQYNRSALGRTPSKTSTNTVLGREPNCHWCLVNPSEVADHEPSLVLRWNAGEFDNMTSAQAQSAADDPQWMVGSCASCNASKAGRSVGTGPGQWDPRTSPQNRLLGGPDVLPWIW